MNRNSLVEVEHGADRASCIVLRPFEFLHAFSLFLANPTPETAVRLEQFGVRVVLGSYDPDRIQIQVTPDAQMEAK